MANIDLLVTANQIRRDIVEMTSAAQSGHPGGSLSATDILVALYFEIMNIDPSQPLLPSRDRFILSKGHASPVMYATLARRGFFSPDELNSFRQINSRLQGHVHVMTPGVDMSAGSLGQGLSFALGTALAGKLDDNPYRVYAMVGDGECNEGQIWEAAMAASFYNANNLTLFVDRNRIQNDRFCDEVMGLEPFADKWKAFGWKVFETEGHDIQKIINTVAEAQKEEQQPQVIIAHTIKGKGVSFMENNPAFHGKAANAEQLVAALKELEI